jgi:peptide chain release factor subunit 1
MITAEMINRVIRFDSGGLPVVSMYIAVEVDPGSRSGVRTRAWFIKSARSPKTARSGTTHGCRCATTSRASRTGCRTIAGTPGTLILFSSSGAGLFEEFHVPRAIRDRTVVDATPWVRPMMAVLDEYHRTCVVVVDREAAQFWQLYVGELREVRQVRDATLRKPDYAGWHGLVEYRVRNKADNLTKRHFRRGRVCVGCALSH